MPEHTPQDATNTEESKTPPKKPCPWGLAWGSALGFLVCWLWINATIPLLWGTPWVILVVALAVAGLLVIWRRKALVLGVGVISFCILGVFCWRTLPLHALDWDSCDRIEIAYWDESHDQETVLNLTDPAEIDAFKAYGRRGHYAGMIKCGGSRRLLLWTNADCRQCFIHGDSIGPAPGGSCQTIFVPSKAGLGEFVTELIQRHGKDKASDGQQAPR